jgi:hypothetical protein
VEQSSQQRARDPERRVRDHVERLARQEQVSGVRAHDDDATPEPGAQPGGASWMCFDCDDAVTGIEQRSRHDAEARPHVDDERPTRQARVSDERRGTLRAELVPSPPPV